MTSIACLLVSLFAADPEGLLIYRQQLVEARTTYNLELAEHVVIRLNQYDIEAPSTELLQLLTEARLAVCTLARIEYEETPESERERRRQLGNRIDEHARTALDLCNQLPENSERFRMEADLWGSMIRSKFRAKRYRRKMESAVERALELDTGNVDAYVTSAALLIFADETHGGDPETAVKVLHRALELDPSHEPARLLLAYAYEQLELPSKARMEYETALNKNPQCLPAQRALERLAGALCSQ